MKKLVTSVLLVFITSVILGQVGSNDPSFNSTDQGFGYGDGATNASVLALQPDGKILVVGYNQELDYFEVQGYGRRSIIVRMNADGTVDPTFVAPEVSWLGKAYSVLLQPDGKILLGGNFTTINGTSTNRITRLNTDGSLDAAFNIGGVGANGTVTDMVLQPDGKVILSGSFTSVNGVASNSIARLNADGSVDAGFNVGAGPNSAPYSLHLLNDGRLLVGGRFTSFNGTAASWVVRLQSNGIIDPAFVSAGFLGSSANNPGVYTMDVQADGRIVFGGSFAYYGGIPRRGVVRTMPDGTSDSSFALDWMNVSSRVYSLHILADGKILFAGAELSSGSGDGGVRRVLVDGSADPSYTPVNMPSYTSWGSHLTLLSNSKILVCGPFTRIGGITRRGIALLNADGSVDTAFYPSTGANDEVEDMIRLPDGRILIGGSFTTYNGQERQGIARLLADGSIDPSFIPSSPSALKVEKMAVDASGRVVILGQWSIAGSSFSRDLFRLLPDGQLDPTFAPYGGQDTTITSMAIGPDQHIYFSVARNGVNSLRRMSGDRIVDPSYNISANSSISGLLFQPDGKLLVSGIFSELDGVYAPSFKRLHPDGTRDASFNSGLLTPFRIESMALQPDGKIIVGMYLSNATSPRIKRLNADGSVDVTFNTGSDASNGGAYPAVYSLIVQPDGKILAGGWFSHFNGLARKSIVRLTSTGAVDPTFDPITGSWYIKTMALQPDGNVLVAGSFTSYAGIGRNRVARVLGGTNSTVQVDLSVHLAGPYAPTTQLMADQLRTAGLVPLSEPYTALGYNHNGSAGGPLTPSVLSTTGNNAIVDWVMVELRHLTTSVVHSQCALVQRDGDIVGQDGTSALNLPVAAGAYHVAVRHRNHLGVMTAAPVALSSTATVIDFTVPSTPTYGTNAQQNINGTMAFWPGDANFDGTAIYTGTNNDRDLLLTAIGGTIPTNTVTNTYSPLDINMDGTIRYTGTNNDRDIILQTIGGVVPTATRAQQLP